MQAPLKKGSSLFAAELPFSFSGHVMQDVLGLSHDSFGGAESLMAAV